MGLSESRIEMIRWSGVPEIRSVVTRLLDTRAVYSRWRSFHYGLLKDVAASRNLQEQRAQFRKASFSLIHRQALFEHLRVSRVMGREREAIFSVLYSSADYSRAVIAEHGRYLQANSSLFCTDYLESSVMDDSEFSAGLADYREKYLQYFGVYCDWIIAEDRGEDYALRPLIPELKKELLQGQLQLLRIPNTTTTRATRLKAA
jgi:hypothetical protein